MYSKRKKARKFVRKQKLTDDHLQNYCVDVILLALLACCCLKNVIFSYYYIIISLYIWRSFGTLCLGTKWKMELWYCGFTRRFFYWILNYLPLQSSPGPNQIQETDETNIFWKTNRNFIFFVKVWLMTASYFWWIIGCCCFVMKHQSLLLEPRPKCTLGKHISTNLTQLGQSFC